MKLFSRWSFSPLRNIFISLSSSFFRHTELSVPLRRTSSLSIASAAKSVSTFEPHLSSALRVRWARSVNFTTKARTLELLFYQTPNKSPSAPELNPPCSASKHLDWYALTRPSSLCLNSYFAISFDCHTWRTGRWRQWSRHGVHLSSQCFIPEDPIGWTTKYHCYSIFGIHMTSIDWHKVHQDKSWSWSKRMVAYGHTCIFQQDNRFNKIAYKWQTGSFNAACVIKLQTKHWAKNKQSSSTSSDSTNNVENVSILRTFRTMLIESLIMKVNW